MAITDTELNIASTSYTNKDFESIYTELLDIATKISNKYNPVDSNESDPFIVLLKLMAFCSDKINYNSDKNLLERFMTSATQESSMQDLTSMLGYNMHYYIAPETTVIFNYTYDENYTGDIINIPKYSIITDDSGSIDFITTEATSILKETNQSEKEIRIIQGTLHNFTVLGNNKITLQNLDSNNRLYFPEAMVAENGVFIEGGTALKNDSTKDTWILVDNLNTQEYGSKVYVFRYDSKRRIPYIEFPEWINLIIDDGLTIDYITTYGAEGNIKAKSLGACSIKDLPADIDPSYIVAINYSGAVNGSNPETINEAYNGFKKTIGTFDTLVTCRDYANAIYNALDSKGNHYVSNVQVADRRTDINYGSNVLTYNGVNNVINSRPREGINGNHLCLYPLKNVKEKSFNSNNDLKYYNESFEALEDSKAIQDMLENGKTLSHDYIKPQSGDIYAIKNYYKLDAIVSTTSKVSRSESVEIIKNINIALANNFNAREVDFGYEITYDQLLKVMREADNRIKRIDLRFPEINPKALIVNDVQKTTIKCDEKGIEEENWFKTIIRKNVTSGKIELFDYDTTFEYPYNINTTSLKGVPQSPVYALSYTSKTNIGKINTTTYTLQDNEVIQFIATAYNPDVHYGYGINYHLELKGGEPTQHGPLETKPSDWNILYRKYYYYLDNDKNNEKIYVKNVNDWKDDIEYYYDTYNNTYIPQNSEYKLNEGDLLIFQYTDESGNSIGRVFKPGEVIKPNIDLFTTEYRKSIREGFVKGEEPLKKDYRELNSEGVLGKTQENDFFMLNTNDRVDYMKPQSQVFDSRKKCYWYVNNSENKINWINNVYLLEEGEYFFITDAYYQTLYSFGSGTKLIRSSDDVWANKTCNKVKDLSELNIDGLSGLQDYFINIELTKEKYLKAIQQEIITLTAGDKILTEEGEYEIPDNTFNFKSPVGVKIKYVLEGQDLKELNDRSSQASEDKWFGRCLLDINAGPNDAQRLCGNQSITITYVEEAGDWDKQEHEEKEFILKNTEETYEVEDEDEEEVDLITRLFKFNILEQKSGGDSVSLDYLDLLCDYKNNRNYPLIATYEEHSKVDPWVITVDNNDSNYYNLRVDFEKENVDKEVYIPLHNPKDKITMFMLYVPRDRSVKINSTEDFGAEEFSGLGYDEEGCLVEGIHIIKLNKGSKGIYLSCKSSAGNKSITLKLSKLRYINKDGKEESALNPLLGYKGSWKDIMCDDKGKILPDLKDFNFINFIDNSRKINVTDSYNLSSAKIFYDYNNIANKWIIPQIDFANSSILIDQSFLK